MTVGAGFGAFAVYAQGAFLASYLMRNYGPKLEQLGGGLGQAGVTGIALGLIMGVGGAVGTLGGGRLADWWSKGRGIRYLDVCAIACIVAAPSLIGALVVTGLYSTFVLLALVAILCAAWAGPYYAGVLVPVERDARPTAAAVALLIVNLIGLGLGPFTIGTLSDYLSTAMGPAEGLRWSLAACALANVLAGLLFLAARTALKSDLARKGV
jgi:predicted MFS family arabinose efflux permease